MTETLSTPRRRWFRFSLRTLFVVMTAAAATVGIWRAAGLVQEAAILTALSAACLAVAYRTLRLEGSDNPIHRNGCLPIIVVPALFGCWILGIVALGLWIRVVAEAMVAD
jgi:hypothetical protein